MTEVQRSFDPSILERQVTAAADLQAFQVTGSNQPSAEIPVCTAAVSRMLFPRHSNLRLVGQAGGRPLTQLRDER